ncbi:hypothetical protein KBB05_00880 [Patescibacteria group bacterium]|nr:hypothetical protein [Patescibacteria group bacterium]
MVIGTHASIKASVLAQTEPIDVDPHELRQSETNLIVYGKLIFVGITYSTAFSASLPCPISRLPVPLILIASLTEKGGKL